MGVQGSLISILLVDEEAAWISHRAMDQVKKISRLGSRLLCQFMKEFDGLGLMPGLDDIGDGNTNHLGLPFF